MMSLPEAITVQLQATDKPPTTTTVQISEWTKARSATKAWKMAGIVLAAAALMIPIPIVHFFAIPVVLIGAPVVWIGVYKLHLGGKDMSGAGACPQCQAELTLSGAADRWPLSRTCPTCRSTIAIVQS